ncbi:MAG: hypothetical protein JNK15_17595 [Planctomycetes bacterium]|nr:hypothetical protein [Planctomycetota bacterium]
MNPLHRWIAIVVVAVAAAACFAPPIHYTGYVTGVDVVGMTRPNVIRTLGLPTAASASGDLLYAIPSAFYHFNGEQLVYRIVRFDARGVVREASPVVQTSRTVESLCTKL